MLGSSQDTHHHLIHNPRSYSDALMNCAGPVKQERPKEQVRTHGRKTSQTQCRNWNTEQIQQSELKILQLFLVTLLVRCTSEQCRNLCRSPNPCLSKFVEQSLHMDHWEITSPTSITPLQSIQRKSPSIIQMYQLFSVPTFHWPHILTSQQWRRLKLSVLVCVRCRPIEKVKVLKWNQHRKEKTKAQGKHAGGSNRGLNCQLDTTQMERAWAGRERENERKTQKEWLWKYYRTAGEKERSARKRSVGG